MPGYPATRPGPKRPGARCFLRCFFRRSRCGVPENTRRRCRRQQQHHAAARAPSVCVHAELEPQGVYIVAEVLEAAGEKFNVRLEIPVSVAFVLLPAVVEIDVLVAA